MVLQKATLSPKNSEWVAVILWGHMSQRFSSLFLPFFDGLLLFDFLLPCFFLKFKNSTTIFIDHIFFSLLFWMAVPGTYPLPTLRKHSLICLWTPGPRDCNFSKAYLPSYVCYGWGLASSPTASIWNIHCLIPGDLSSHNLGFVVCLFPYPIAFIRQLTK